MGNVDESVPDSLRYPGFRWLLSAELVSRLGDTLHEVALIWLVLEATGDPLLVSVTVVASTVPKAAASLPAGLVVDRVNRKYVMMASSLLRGVIVLAIPLFARGSLLVPVVVTVAAVTGALEAFVYPARQSLVPELVEDRHLDSANGLVEVVNTFSKAAYAVSGAVVAVFGAYGAFYLDAASFLLAAGALIGVPTAACVPPDENEAGATGRWASMREGIDLVRTSPVLPSVVFVWVLLGVAMGPLGVVLPALTDGQFRDGSLAFGVLYGGIYTGIGVGGVLMSRFGEVAQRNRSTLVAGGVAATGGLLLLTAAVSRVGGGLLAMAIPFALAGVSTVAVWVSLRTITQRTVPDEALGRVTSIVSAVGTASLPVSVALAGVALRVVSPRTFLAVEGVLLVASSVPLLSRLPTAVATAAGTDAD
ncbi:MAG: MFS transporter [Halobaculum sp.]